MYRPLQETQEIVFLKRPTTSILSPNRIFTGLIYAVILLTVLSMIGQAARFMFALQEGRPLSRLASFFYLNKEGNLPTFFSSNLLLVAALLLSYIACQYVQQPGFSRYIRLSWVFLAFVFFFLSLDEYAMIHEKLNPEMHRIGTFTGWFYYAWVVPGIAGVTILGLFFLKFLMHLPPATRRQFVLAGALYVGGALGMELIGGRHAYLYGSENFTYTMLATIEEALEMLGASYFIYALLNFIQMHIQSEITIKLGRA